MMRKSISMLAAVALVAAAGTASAQDLTWTAQADDLSALSALALPPSIPAGNQMHGTAAVEVGGTTYVYMFGGNAAGPGEVRNIHFAPIVGNTVGAWTAATAELTNAAGTLGGASQTGVGTTYATRSTVSYNGRIYQAGGRSNVGDADNRWNGVRVFTPVAGGDIPPANVDYYNGAEDTTNTIAAVTPLFERLETTALINANSKSSPGNAVLYVLGGATDSVQKMFISGTTGEIIGAGPLVSNFGRALGNAVTSGGTLPGTRQSAPAVQIGDFVYVIGGVGTATSVIRATIQNDDNLSAFTTLTALPEGRFDGGAVAINGTIYVIGGCVTGNNDIRNTVYYTTPDAITGDITTWNTGSTLPVTHPDAGITPGVRRVGAIAVGDMAIVVGGRMANTVEPVRTGQVFVGRDISTINDWIMH